VFYEFQFRSVLLHFAMASADLDEHARWHHPRPGQRRLSVATGHLRLHVERAGPARMLRPVLQILRKWEVEHSSDQPYLPRRVWAGRDSQWSRRSDVRGLLSNVSDAV
jgi:hypothetical protein